MRRQEFDEALGLGRATAEVIELARRHCRHARIEAVDGNSWVGSMVGLPMGPVEVRCEYAPAPLAQGHQALELAIEFYQANCIWCPHRDPTGELPSLATVAGKRAAEEQAQKAAARKAADVRAQRHYQRRERRHQLMAGEGHVVRDLVEALDRIYSRAQLYRATGWIMSQTSLRRGKALICYGTYRAPLGAGCFGMH